MASMQHGFVDASGVRTHYVETGEGKPLVFIHGGGAGADGYSNFAHCLPAFAERGFRAIAVDMIGFGETDKPDPATFQYTQSARTQHMVDFLDALGLNRLALIGNSMGGTTAMGVVQARPEMVTELVLMGAAINMTPEILQSKADTMKPVVAYDGTLEGMKRVLSVMTHNYEAPMEHVQYRQRLASRPDALAAYKATQKWAKENGLFYTDEQLGSVPCPVFVIAGKNDQVISLDRTFATLSQIPQAIGHILPNCGHWVMIEYPEEFTRQTLLFLKAD